MIDHILADLKAIAAFVGTGITAVVATDPNLPHWIALVGVGLTAAAVYGVPNKPLPPVDKTDGDLGTVDGA